MKRSPILFLMVCAVLAFVPAIAEEETEAPAEFLAMSYEVMVLPGHELDFEKALAEHWKLHEAAGDDWTWQTWVQVTGKKTGMYSIRTAGHTWADFDHDAGVEGDREDVIKNIMPHTKWSGVKVSEWDLELSHWPDDLGIPKMVELTVFHLKPGSQRGFYHALGEISAFLKEEEIPWNWAWGHTVSGGSGATAILAIPHDNWASFKDDGINMWKMLEEAKGRIETDLLMEEITSAIEWQENFAVEHVPELSYSGAATEKE